MNQHASKSKHRRTRNPKETKVDTKVVVPPDGHQLQDQARDQWQTQIPYLSKPHNNSDKTFPELSLIPSVQFLHESTM